MSWIFGKTENSDIPETCGTLWKEYFYMFGKHQNQAASGTLWMLFVVMCASKWKIVKQQLVEACRIDVVYVMLIHEIVGHVWISVNVWTLAPVLYAELFQNIQEKPQIIQTKLHFCKNKNNISKINMKHVFVGQTRVPIRLKFVI